MSITLGTTTFDTEDLDLRSLFLDVLVPHIKMPTHLLAIVSDVQSQSRRLVMEHNCKREITLHKVTQPGHEVQVEFVPYFVGFSKTAKATTKKKKAVIDALVSMSGFSHPIELEGEMRKRFGTFKAKVPIKEFIKRFGETTEFKVDVHIYWDMLRIKLPAGAPSGDVLVAFPYGAQFQGRAIRDCKTKKRFSVMDHDTFYNSMSVPWVPKDDTVRAAAEAAVEKQVEVSRGSVKFNERVLKDYKEQLLESPNDKELKSLIKRYEAVVKDAKRQLKDDIKMRDAMRG